MKRTVILLLSLVASLALSAQSPSPAGTGSTKSVDEMSDKEIADRLKTTTGHIALSGGKTALELSGGYGYLNVTQSKFLLEDLWGNPPADDFLGMVVPPHFDPFATENSWAALLSYDDTGHINDDDARDLNYDDLLKQIEEQITQDNEERKKNGYSLVHINGWAAKPHYDGTTHKMYWAKNIKFDDQKDPILNYEIRVLGREGVLDLNLIATLNDLQTIEKETPGLLNQVNFVNGQRYEDYNSSTDHLAEFGVAGLILGGIALKAGLLKVIITFLAASWKFILIGVAAVGAFLVRVFRGRKARAAQNTSNSAPVIESPTSSNEFNPPSEPGQNAGQDSGSGDTDPNRKN